MKPKNMIVLAVAAACGLVAAVIASKSFAGGGGPEKVQVVVAKKELTSGTTITEKNLTDMLEYHEFTKEALPPEVLA